MLIDLYKVFEIYDVLRNKSVVAVMLHVRYGHIGKATLAALYLF